MCDPVTLGELAGVHRGARVQVETSDGGALSGVLEVVEHRASDVKGTGFGLHPAGLGRTRVRMQSGADLTLDSTAKVTLLEAPAG